MQLKTKKVSGTQTPLNAEKVKIPGGQLQTIAASVLMKILCGAQMARYGLLGPACRLACYVANWKSVCDKRLHRLICCLNASLSKRMVGWIVVRPIDLTPHVYTDADLGACERI